MWNRIAEFQDGNLSTIPRRTSRLARGEVGLLTEAQSRSAGEQLAARELASRHFTMQDERPPALSDVDIAQLALSLRTLLFTDGTVTRTLEVQALRRIRIQVVEQHPCAVSGRTARYIGASDNEECIRRRIEMFVGDADGPAVWAESHMVLGRLPAEFLRVLAKSPEGLGAALQRLMVESTRQLLWFGLGQPPEWSTTTPTSDVLTRLYRVMTHGQTAMTISESFAVEISSGIYSLPDLSGIESNSARRSR
jgi:chorismate-pyruvate lyase